MKQLQINKLQNSLRNKFLKSKVNMIAPETIYFSKDTKIGKNVTTYFEKYFRVPFPLSKQGIYLLIS